MMLGYYIGLGFRHLRRNPVLTGLIVITLAVGVAASMATTAVLRAMSADPIPHKSDRLFVPLVDVRPVDNADPDPEPPDQLTYRDVIGLHDAKMALRQSAMFQLSPVLDPGRPDYPPFFSDGLAIHADFFAMLEIPFVRGGPWTAEDEARATPVVVLRDGLADRLFPDGDPIGRTVRLGTKDYTVTGTVADGWEPLPRFYRLVAGSGPFAETEDVFVSFPAAIAAEMDQQGNTNCYDDGDDDDLDGYEGLKQSNCVWIQLWVELASPADAPAYRDFMTAYVAEQRKLGRFPRADNNRLHDVIAWLRVNKVVAKDARLQTYLAFGFLLVCLVNVVGLLLAKFMARSGEIGVRRALGARRRAVFQQYLIEAGVLGLAGGLVGVGLTYLSLRMIARQSPDLAALARLDGVMLAVTFALSVIAAVVAGLLPTWRACQVQPALQLKSQ